MVGVFAMVMPMFVHLQKIRQICLPVNANTTLLEQIVTNAPRVLSKNLGDLSPKTTLLNVNVVIAMVIPTSAIMMKLSLPKANLWIFTAITKVVVFVMNASITPKVSIVILAFLASLDPKVFLPMLLILANPVLAQKILDILVIVPLEVVNVNAKKLSEEQMIVQLVQMVTIVILIVCLVIALPMAQS